MSAKEVEQQNEDVPAKRSPKKMVVLPSRNTDTDLGAGTTNNIEMQSLKNRNASIPAVSEKGGAGGVELPTDDPSSQGAHRARR